MDPRVAEILRHAAVLALVGLLAVVGLKVHRHFRDRAELAAELRSLAAEGSFYRQFYPADAERALLRAMAVLREGELDGLAPDELLDRCLGLEAKRGEQADEPTADEQLVRATFLNNYENCRKLGVLRPRDAAKRLREGELPPIEIGPATGSRPRVMRIIDPALAPGLDKVVANLEIRPPDSVPAAGDVERNAARRLVRTLGEAGVLDTATVARILQQLEPPPPAGGR
jgi:hypothetical protein